MTIYYGTVYEIEDFMKIKIKIQGTTGAKLWILYGLIFFIIMADIVPFMVGSPLLFIYGRYYDIYLYSFIVSVKYPLLFRPI